MLFTIYKININLCGLVRSFAEILVCSIKQNNYKEFLKIFNKLKFIQKEVFEINKYW